jgi:hypothetical protein
MNKPLFPDSIRPRLPYPFLGDRQLNIWAFTALALAIGARWSFRQPWLPEGAGRWAIALAPLLPSYLYARRLVQWTLGVDEMQRRILQEALLFAAMWTVFLRMALDMVAATGGSSTLWLRFGLGIEGTFAVMCALYVVGCVLANRRYQ